MDVLFLSISVQCSPIEKLKPNLQVVHHTKKCVCVCICDVKYILLQSVSFIAKFFLV
jgi:hypothetical protein